MTELSDRELARVLERAADGGGVDASRRQQIRAQVVAEFDRCVGDPATAPLAPLVLLPESATEPETHRGAPERRGRWALSAAAAVVVVGGLVVVANRDPDEQPVDEAPPVLTTTSFPPTTTAARADLVLPSIDGLTIGEPIPTGRYTTDVAGGLSFEVPDGVQLSAVTAESVTLDRADADASVKVVTIPSVSRLDAALERAEAEGVLRVESSAGSVGDRSVVRRDLTLTAAGIERYGCVVGTDCDVLGNIDTGLSSLQLRSGAENFITPLNVGAGGDIAVVERFASLRSTTSAVAGMILETIEPLD